MFDLAMVRSQAYKCGAFPRCTRGQHHNIFGRCIGRGLVDGRDVFHQHVPEERVWAVEEFATRPPWHGRQKRIMGVTKHFLLPALCMHPGGKPDKCIRQRLEFLTVRERKVLAACAELQQHQRVGNFVLPGI